MKPVAASVLGVPGGMADKRGGNALPLMLTGDRGVEDEGVVASVPRHIDEADQALSSLPRPAWPSIRSPEVGQSPGSVPARCRPVFHLKKVMKLGPRQGGMVLGSRTQRGGRARI
jgi:hypothetical protein